MSNCKKTLMTNCETTYQTMNNFKIKIKKINKPLNCEHTFQFMSNFLIMLSIINNCKKNLTNYE